MLSSDRHVYDNVVLKGERHIYENVGELRDATPDLILAVKPKLPLEDEQVRTETPDGFVLGARRRPDLTLSFPVSVHGRRVRRRQSFGERLDFTAVVCRPS